MKRTVLKNTVSCLSALLLFTLTPAVGNGQNDLIRGTGVIGVIDVPSHPFQDAQQDARRLRPVVQQAESTDRPQRATEYVVVPVDPFNPQEQVRQDFQRTVQTLQGLSQRLQRVTPPDDPLAREFQFAIAELQVAAQRLQRTAATPPVAVRRVAPPPAPTTQMEIAREQAYIALARQYFFVLSSTPAEPPLTLRSMAVAGLQQQAQQPAPSPPSMRIMRVVGEDGREFVEVIDEVVETETISTETVSEAEEWAQKRAEMRGNFVECIQKISPMARITLISELIRSSHTSEELRLLEALLDDVVMPPTGPSTGQPTSTGRASGQIPILSPFPFPSE